MTIHHAPYIMRNFFWVFSMAFSLPVAGLDAGRDIPQDIPNDNNSVEFSHQLWDSLVNQHVLLINNNHESVCRGDS